MGANSQHHRYAQTAARRRALLAIGGALCVGVAGHGVANNVPASRPSTVTDAVRLLPALNASNVVPERPDAEEARPASQFRIVVRAPAIAGLEALLVESGVGATDAKAVHAAMIREFADRYAEGDDMQLDLSLNPAGDGHIIHSLAVLGDLGRLQIAREGERFVRGIDGDELTRFTLTGSAYWEGRRAGLDWKSAMALAEKVDAWGREAKVQFVTGERPDRFDGRSRHRLLYVVADTAQGKREFLRDTDEWVAVGAGARVNELMRPALGRVTSAFGWRTHPILGFARPHNGIDIAAGWGAPIYAAADGIVSAASWRGGYGRQVRIAHPGGTITTYSHLSSMAVDPTSRVRRGQVIGYAGASGLATGPHLHFEVLRGGRPVDPMTASMGAKPGQLENRQIAERLRLVRAARAA